MKVWQIILLMALCVLLVPVISVGILGLTGTANLIFSLTFGVFIGTIGIYAIEEAS